MAKIADELIILEREHAKKAVPSLYALVAARAVLARRGLTVTDPAQAATPQPQPAAQPPPAAPPNPSPNHRSHECSYCGSTNHSVATCLKKKTDLQQQVDEIEAAFKAKVRPPRSNRSNKPATGTALLTVSEPPVQPPPLKAQFSMKADKYFKQHLVPSKQFWY